MSTTPELQKAKRALSDLEPVMNRQDYIDTAIRIAAVEAQLDQGQALAAFVRIFDRKQF